MDYLSILIDLLMDQSLYNTINLQYEAFFLCSNKYWHPWLKNAFVVSLKY